MSLNEMEQQQEQILEGTIIKGYSGFYYVACDGVIYECSLRGKNRKKSVKFLPGDKVKFSISGDATKGGAIEEVLPRKNELVRPPAANLDQLVILAALYDPLPGFPVYLCSTVTGQGVADMKAVLHGKCSVLAGNSGVGKSSLMNAISDQWELATGEISDKLKRGKHTTRHVELFQLDKDTLIADTPGFSSLQLPEDIKREELCRLFPEFLSRLGGCRFATCMHKSEPDCAIKEALAQGEIAQSRYDNYLAFLDEVIQQERSF